MFLWPLLYKTLTTSTRYYTPYVIRSLARWLLSAVIRSVLSGVRRRYYVTHEFINRFHRSIDRSVNRFSTRTLLELLICAAGLSAQVKSSSLRKTVWRTVELCSDFSTHLCKQVLFVSWRWCHRLKTRSLEAKLLPAVSESCFIVFFYGHTHDMFTTSNTLLCT